MSLNDSTNPSARIFRHALLVGASAIATCSLPAAAIAQDAASSPEVAPEDNAPNTATADQTGGGTASNTGQVGPAATSVEGDEIVVTGVRASLQRARDIKRTSTGVVDAVSAEEIGKFPDTNLAESLQRIPGVSIERRNGEGSRVTVRGFGPQFNMVTLNGRQMATSDIEAVGGDQNVDFARATGRAFDFSNLASEGVSRLELYKTGRAAIPSGGIGATINVVTSRPLDGRDSGLRGSVGAKALYDTSLDDFKVTPELSGIVSWSDPADTIGMTLFGSFAKRESAAPSATVNNWDMATFATFANSNNGYVRPAGGTAITNPPPATQLVAIPKDSRYHYSESDRKRINLQGTVQFRPMDNLTLTADGLYAQNKVSEQRSDQTNWFSRPFDQVTFDDDDVVATPVFLRETLTPGTKDVGFEQQYRATKSKLKSFGLNANWEIVDGLTLNLDANRSNSKSTPNSANGASSTLVSFGAPVVEQHSVTFDNEIPQQTWTLEDCDLWDHDSDALTPDVPRGTTCNNTLDIGDLGTQVQRINAARQSHRVTQFRGDLGWDLGAGTRFDIGSTYIKSKMTSERQQYEQELGGWNIPRPGDVADAAGSLIDTFCMQCQFDNYSPTGAEVAFRGNAVELWDAFEQYYTAQGHPVRLTGNEFDAVKERILSLYTQFSWKGDIAGRNAGFVAGVRWENTKVNSDTLIALPERIVWTSDNDFRREVSSSQQPYGLKGEYTNILPSFDFQIEPVDNVVARVSVSKTIARPDYGNLFASQAANQPGNPTALGGQATGTSGDPDLNPLISSNFDVSLEWYYDRSSYVSAGFFAKKVKNFIGTSVVEQSLFGLRDPSSGAPGSRSGTALTYLQNSGVTVSEANLFVMTALLVRHNNNLALAQADFENNLVNGTLNPGFVTLINDQYDIIGNETDPLFSFGVTTPINTATGNIHGVELQGQHFFGDTGFGISGSLTKVFGDVKFDRGQDPAEEVFALTGLSDSANVTGIFEKHGFSARVAYNWRGRFLAALNRGGAANRNPVYFEPFGTLDASLGYDLNDRLTLSLEAVNLLSEPIRSYSRSRKQLWFAQEGKPRFWLGARYRFGGDAAPVVAAPAYSAPLPPPATQTCPDGSVILASDACPVQAPPPPPAAAPEGERG